MNSRQFCANSQKQRRLLLESATRLVVALRNQDVATYNATITSEWVKRLTSSVDILRSDGLQCSMHDEE
jgi:hypothetical protein